MKNQQHLLVPLVLVVAAVVVGFSTIAVNYSQPQTVPSGNQAVNTAVSSPEAVVSVISVSANTAAAAEAGSRVVTWKTSDFPRNGTVSINLLRKVGDNPTAYELVATLALNTQNDGSESWIPSSEEGDGDLYIEVVCGSGISGGCRSGGAPVKAY